MKKLDMIPPLVLLALSGLLFLETSSLPIGSFRAPQVGFMPLLLAILLVCLSLMMLGQILMASKSSPGHARLSAESWKRVTMAVGGLIAFGLLFESIGYITTTFLLITFLMKAVQPHRWWVALTVAAISASFTYAVFTLLGTTLPRGILA